MEIPEMEAGSIKMRMEIIKDFLDKSEIEIKTGPFGTQLKAAEYQSSGTPVLNVKNLGFSTINAEKLDKVGAETVERLKAHLLKAGDIVFGRKGAVERHAFISVNEEGWMQGSDCIRLRVKTDMINPRFLSYYFLTKEHRAFMISMCSHGTTMASLNQKILEQICFPMPQRNIQDKIVDILEKIDRKIALNNRINDNLEQQALALFKQYFMDYMPYGETAPADWREVSLEDVCIKITDGSHYSPVDSPDSSYPMYSVKDMETYGFNSSSCKHITEEEFHKMQKNDCVPQMNDILVAKDGSYLKEIFICSEQKDEAILSSIAIFRPDASIIIPEILLYLLKQPSVRKDVGDNYVSGSALPRIVLKDFKKYRFMLPPMEEQLKIGSVLHAIRMQTKSNIDEIHVLSSLRDILLPRFMSGELDVSDLDL